MLKDFSFNNYNNAIAITLKLPEVTISECQHSLNELILLAKTLNIKVLTTFIQNRNKIEPDFFIGKGKLEEIKNYIQHNNINVVLFDNELNGIQERNLEKYLNKIIFSRTEIILDIFLKRAKTTESKLQVQLASLQYMMPRLKNRWDHFSRVEGGIGTLGGEGEKQIELDRRIIKNQISKIKDKLEKVDIQMKNRRKKRIDKNLISIVGYTNAGKSTLFNTLSRSNVFTEDMLFATLDSTTRKVYINENLTILLSDTVGFINNLPHQLIASFKSTLDEIIYSKLILHVIDITSLQIENNIATVNNILMEIGAINIPIINIFNKIDLKENNDFIFKHDKDDLYISALNNIGINQLKERINNFFSYYN